MPTYGRTPPPQPLPTPARPLAEDGDLGPLTVQALQRSLNATGADPRLLVDGNFGRASRRALQARLNHVQSPVGVDGDFGPRSTRALQHYLHRIAGPCAVDGEWGRAPPCACSGR